MARQQKDVFGFDELEKALLKMESRYEDSADIMLATFAEQTKKRARQKTTRVTGELRRKWSVKKPKGYKNDKVKVSVLLNKAPHGHLYEDGHRMITGGKARVRGKNLTERQLQAQGIKNHGRVPGRKVLQTTFAQSRREFQNKARVLLIKMVDEVQI